MSDLLMPRATAVWLIDNTALTFEQIGDLCALHHLEVQSIADGEAAIGIQGYDPLQNGQLTAEEIKRCEADPEARLELAKSELPAPTRTTKGPRYVPVARRSDKPDAIAWIVKNHPEVKDSQIVKLIGTTKDTIAKIRDRTHWNITNITPKHPVPLGLCAKATLYAEIERAGGVPEPKQAEAAESTESPAVDERAPAFAAADGPQPRIPDLPPDPFGDTP